MPSTDFHEIITNWLSAIGTIGAVIVALFQRTFSNWHNRPKISVSCSKKTPFIETIDINTDSSTKEKELKIRIKVENKGNYTADHCIVFIDCYYEKREKEEKYCKRELVPIQLRDYRNTTLTDIAPHLTYLIDVAAIRKTDQKSRSGDTSQYHQFYKLDILGDKAPSTLGKGTFIIPIKISSPKMKTYIGYLKLYWDSDTFSTDEINFGLEMITKTDFKALKKI